MPHTYYLYALQTTHTHGKKSETIGRFDWPGEEEAVPGRALPFTLQEITVPFFLPPLPGRQAGISASEQASLSV